MAYVQRQPNGRWRVRYRDPDGVLRSRTFTRKLDADRHAAKVSVELDAGEWLDPRRSRMKLAEWSDRWRATKVDLRRSTLARLDATLTHHVVPAFGARELRSITNADVREWVTQMRTGGLSASSTRKAYFALSQMLAAAVADRRLSHNPADDVPLPAEQYGDQRFLTAAEVATLADAIYPRYRALVLVAVYGGGLRFGECAALRRRHVDVLRGRLDVRETLVDVNGELSFGPTKTKHGQRVVPVPRGVMAEIEEHLGEYVESDADALLFTSTTGTPLRRAGFRRNWWLPAVREADLAPFKFHELKHTFVALAIAAGADPKQVSVRAGHSSVAFTLDRYGHLFDDGEDKVTDRLEALFTSARPAADGTVRRLR